MALYNDIHDRQYTQLAYKVKYFPMARLSQAGQRLIVWCKKRFFSKKEIEARCNEDKTKLHLRGEAYHIVWAYNCIPTVHEWEKFSNLARFDCEFRCSPAVPETYYVVLSTEKHVVKSNQSEQSTSPAGG